MDQVDLAGWDGTTKNEQCRAVQCRAVQRGAAVETIETQLFGRSGHDAMQRAGDREKRNCRMSGLFGTDALASDVIW